MSCADDWARCAPWIEAALAYCHGTHTLEDVAVEVLRGDAQFWPFERCAVVTEILYYPRKKTLHFWLCGGDLKQLLEVRPHIEVWGKAQGCSEATLAGRPGWRRVLRGFGYAPVWSVCAKSLG
jgi:hypothetical protein